MTELNSLHFVIASPETIQLQEKLFQELMDSLGLAATPEEIQSVLDAREIVEPEPELSAEAIARLRQKIAAKSKV